MHSTLPAATKHDRTTRRWALPALVALCAAAVVVTPATASALPSTLQVEGVLLAAGGSPAADGGYDLTFSLYAAKDGGNALWQEVLSGVAVSGGRFSAVLGVTKPIGAVVLTDNDPWFGVQVGADPELPRQPLRTVAYAVVAATANALSCTGCVGSDQLGNGTVAAAKVAFNYAASATKGGPAIDLACTGCVSVAELKFDADVDLGGNSIKGANATFSGDVAAKTVTAASYTGDGSKLTGIALPKGGCPAGQAVVGIASDGALVCKVFSALLPPDGLDEVSNGLLTNQFVETVAIAAAVGIPDNTGASANASFTVPDWGVSQAIVVKVKVVNTDLSTLALQLLPPDDKKVGFTLCDPCGDKDLKALDTSWSDKIAPKSGNLAVWLGANPKGSWNLVATDTSFCIKQAAGNSALCDLDNKLDGKITAFSIEVATLSNAKVAVQGLLTTGKGVDFASAPNKGFRHEVSEVAPVVCDEKQIGYTYYNSKDGVLYLCDGKAFQSIAQVSPGLSQQSAGKSCQELLSKGSSKSGVYWIRPLGDTPDDAFQVYCDQVTDGGGWVLAMRLSTDSPWGYTHKVWTNSDDKSGQVPMPDKNLDAVSRAYYVATVKQTRACMARFDDSSWACQVLDHASATPRALANGPALSSSQGTKNLLSATWKSITAGGVWSADAWHRFGWQTGTGSHGGARLGFTADNDSSDSQDSCIGFGLYKDNAPSIFTGSGYFQYPWSPAPNPPTATLAGQIWLR